ncbi:DUF4209 domain-containing protein [soil metagenome]
MTAPIEEWLTLDEVNRYDWQSIAGEPYKFDCFGLSTAFYERSSALKKSDPRGSAVFAFFGNCTSPFLQPESLNQPLKPMFEGNGWNSSIPDDLPPALVALIPDLAPNVRNPELRARLADISWLQQGKYQMALLAIDSYLESATHLEAKGEWTHALDRAERAGRIAAQLGRGDQGRFTQVSTYFEAVLASPRPEDNRRFQPARIMEVMLDLQIGDADRWSELSASLARTAEAERDFDRAEQYWRVKVRWDRWRGDDQARSDAEYHAAECWAMAAEEMLQREPPDYLLAEFNLQKAVTAFRQAGQPTRAKELQNKLLAVQKFTLSEFKSIRESVDVSQLVENAIAAVQGKPFYGALIALAAIRSPASFEVLRSTVEQQNQQFVFTSIFAKVLIDDQGRTTGIRSPRSFGDADEAALEDDMFAHARFQQEIATTAIIEPARQQIALEHPVRQRDIERFLDGNPFVPAERLSLVARGLLAGFSEEFSIAVHLLIPQIENSIRYVLNQRGHVTTGLTDEGIQDEQDLGRLLERAESTAIWGQDLMFELRGLLVARFGTNLRNRIAHGLVNGYELEGWTGRYLWWSALRFYCLPIIVMAQRSGDSDPEST